LEGDRTRRSVEEEFELAWEVEDEVEEEEEEEEVYPLLGANGRLAGTGGGA
jgi:hypothetical protein